MKLLTLISLLAFTQYAMAETEIVRVSSDKATYAPGETAVFRAELFTQPENENLELDITAEFIGATATVAVSTDRITDYTFFMRVENLELGMNQKMKVRVFIQDVRAAKNLKDTIVFYNGRIAEIDEQLQAEQDPQVIADLEAEKAELQDLVAATEEQLLSIRTEIFGPKNKSIDVL